MLNPDSFSALFSSSSAVAVYGFLGSYIGERVLDHILTAKPEQLKSCELISRQLYEALDEALQMTCTEYEWEFDAYAISETFSEGKNMWAGIDSSEKLSSVLSYAIGNDHSNLITEDIAEFWLDAFSRGVACRQQLFNYLHSQENRQIRHEHHDAVENKSQYPCYITDSPDAAVDELVGREAELETLYNLIVNQHKKLVLSGVGGLGKTELTKRFLDRLVNTEVITSGIEEIAWIPYDNRSICISIQRALRLQCDPSEVWQIIQEKATQLQNRLLLVIDNVENPEEDEYLKKISVLQCNILVTSRQKELQGFSDILYLQPLSELSCRKLFYKHYQFDERDDDVLNDIISLTAHLTIMIVFIAKVAYLEGLALHELYGRLVEKGFKLSEEDVSCEHERLQNDDTIIRQMCILFSLVKYSDADKTILTYVSIIPNLRFEFKQAKQWFRIQKNSSLMKLYKMGMLEHITNNRKHIYWMHSVIAAAVREQQKEHLYTLSRPFVDILCEELNTGQVFGKEYEKAYLIPFSWSIADIMEKHWCVEDDTDYLTSLFHICFSCSNYILCEKIIDIVIRVQTDNPAFTAEDLAYSYRNKIDLLMQFDKVEEAAPLFKEVERLMSITDLPENKRNILSYQYGIYNQIRGKYDKAREYFRYCIDCAEKEESITREKDISTAYANMARMLVEAGDFFEAYKCIKKAINAEKEDELDSDQIVCYSTLAGICTELMQAGYGTTYIDEAIAAFDKVIKFREKHLGKHHADTAVIYHDYSYFWYVCGVLDKALEYNEKAYKIDEELFAEHSITRMRTLNTKALIIWDQGDYDKACSTLEYIIKTTEQMGNNYLVDLFDFSFNYARCLHEKGNDTLSKEYYNKCIDIWDSMSGGGSRNLCLVFQEYGDILFSEMNPGEALSKYESALKYNTEDWYIEVDLIDSIAACMMLIGQTDESLQKFAWLLQTLAEDDVKDAETKFQLCNNLACVLNSETEEEIEYKESLFDLVKDDAAVLSYAIHYLDDWLPDSAE